MNHLEKRRIEKEKVYAKYKSLITLIYMASKGVMLVSQCYEYIERYLSISKVIGLVILSEMQQAGLIKIRLFCGVEYIVLTSYCNIYLNPHADKNNVNATNVTDKAIIKSIYVNEIYLTITRGDSIEKFFKFIQNGTLSKKEKNGFKALQQYTKESRDIHREYNYLENIAKGYKCEKYFFSLNNMASRGYYIFSIDDERVQIVQINLSRHIKAYSLKSTIQEIHAYIGNLFVNRTIQIIYMCADTQAKNYIMNKLAKIIRNLYLSKLEIKVMSLEITDRRLGGQKILVE